MLSHQREDGRSGRRESRHQAVDEGVEDGSGETHEGPCVPGMRQREPVTNV